MSPVVVAVVAVAAFVYMRIMRKARLRWLARLDLPGLWQWQTNQNEPHWDRENEVQDGSLVLTGRADRGTFLRREGGQEVAGTWRIVGHTLNLVSEDSNRQALSVHFFGPGNIGLEDELGERRIYVKDNGNVVPLKLH